MLLGLAGCTAEDAEAVAGVFAGIYEMAGSKALVMSPSDRNYAHRHEFHPDAYEGEAVLDMGVPAFTLRDLSAPGLYSVPVCVSAGFGRLGSVTALLGPGQDLSTGALFRNELDGGVPGWEYNARYPGMVDGDLFRQAASLPDGSGQPLLATAYAWIAGLGPLYADVSGYLGAHPGTSALWRMTAIYDGTGLMPAGFLLEFQALDGGMSFSKYVYNVQPGVAFDYATGRNWIEAGGDPMPLEESLPDPG